MDPQAAKCLALGCRIEIPEPCVGEVIVGNEAVGGATARRGNLRVLKQREDSFRNYDFDSRRVSRNNVDWPVNFLFWNNAEIDKVKHAFRVVFPHRGSTKYGRLDDGPGPEWDEDGGVKTIRCSNPAQGRDSYHFRLYARPNYDRMYNRVWGFYDFATSHIDHNECWFGRWHGHTERAEGRISLWARDIYGPSRVDANRRSFGNREPYRREGNHIWSNNGLATYVRVP
jgi:hypothetical protein